MRTKQGQSVCGSDTLGAIQSERSLLLLVVKLQVSASGGDADVVKIDQKGKYPT